MNKWTRIEELNLDKCSYNKLKRYGINTVGELKTLSDKQLLHIPNVGNVTIERVKLCLDAIEYDDAYDDLDEDNDIEARIAARVNFDDDRDFVNTNITMLNYIFPKTLSKDYVMLFCDVDGNICEDLAIKATNMSSMVRRNLTAMGCKTLSDVLKQTYRYVLTGNLMERREHMGRLAVNRLVNSIIQEVTSYAIVFTDNEDVDYETLVDVVKFLIYKSEAYDGISFANIQKMLPRSISLDLITKILDRLQQDGCLTYDQNELLYYYKYDNLMDYIESTFDERTVNIVSDRLNGKTLSQIGQAYDLTRERIRQIVRKVFDGRPIVKEDRYKYWFMSYDIEQSIFCDTFGVEPYVYQYFSIVSKRGAQSLQNIVYDTKFGSIRDARIRNACYDVAYCVRYHTPLDVIEDLLKRNHHNKPCSIEELRQEYIEFCQDSKSLNGFLDVAYDTRGFMLRLTRVGYRKVLLSLCGHKTAIRYYPMDDYDIKKFMKSIDFTRYMNTVISACRIFDDYKDLMQQYSIQNEWELHNFLKKSGYLLPDYINLSRIPVVEVGDVDRDKQVMDLLKSVAPISVNDFAELFNSKYGINKASFLSGWCDSIQQYKSGGMFILSA